MAKRDGVGDGDDGPPRKAQKTSEVDARDFERFTAEFEPVQKILNQLDEECGIEQMRIQRMYDEKKRCHFKARSKIIGKIPDFWPTALKSCAVADEIWSGDWELLDLLRDIDVEDNIDDSGSYRITFTFAPEAAEHMSTLTLVKTITMPPGVDDCPISKPVPIAWAPGKNMVEKFQENAGPDSEVARKGLCSFFDWLTAPSWGGPHFGEPIRRDLWLDPLHFYSAGANGEMGGVFFPEYEDGEDIVESGSDCEEDPEAESMEEE